MPAVPPPDELARLRALYEDARGPTVKAIAASAGISDRRLRDYARRFGWRRRSPAARAAARTASATAASAASAVAPATDRGYPCPGLAMCPERAATVRRLLAACEEQVTQAEARLAAHGEDLVPEREARTLAVLARTIERLVALDQSAAARSSAPAEEDAEDDAIPRDPAELRAELARRLAGLEESGAGE